MNRALVGVLDWHNVIGLIINMCYSTLFLLVGNWNQQEPFCRRDHVVFLKPKSAHDQCGVLSHPHSQSWCYMSFIWRGQNWISTTRHLKKKILYCIFILPTAWTRWDIKLVLVPAHRATGPLPASSGPQLRDQVNVCSLNQHPEISVLWNGSRAIESANKSLTCSCERILVLLRENNRLNFLIMKSFPQTPVGAVSPVWSSVPDMCRSRNIFHSLGSTGDTGREV